MYKLVHAIAAGTLSTTAGIMHFDPKRDDEDGRYQTRILPEADALKAKSKGLVEIDEDASPTDDEYKAQTLGLAARPATVAAKRLEEMDDAPRGDAAGATPGTVALRNFAPGQGRVDSAGDPDAAPAPGQQQGEEGPAILNQSIPKLKAALEDISDVAELDALHTAEGSGQNRDGAKAAIDERKQAVANA